MQFLAKGDRGVVAVVDRGVVAVASVVAKLAVVFGSLVNGFLRLKALFRLENVLSVVMGVVKKPGQWFI